jgi:hypothetical protein
MKKTLYAILYFAFFSIYFANEAVSQQVDNGLQMNPAAARIHILAQRIEDEGKMKDQLNLDSLNAATDLPFGIARKIGDKVYAIAIDSAYSYDEEGWFLNACMSIGIPGTPSGDGYQNKLAFAAKHIRFGKGGLAVTTSARLELVGDHLINLGENLQLKLPGSSANYVEFDCNGFKKIKLTGILIFGGDMLVPDDNKKQVEATFAIDTENLNDILIQTSISPFRVRGLDDFGFQVTKASFDLSDIQNPDNIIFPQGYTDDDVHWRGFYLDSLTAKYYGAERKDKTPLTFLI